MTPDSEPIQTPDAPHPDTRTAAGKVDPAATTAPNSVRSGVWPPTAPPPAAVGRFALGEFHARGGLGEVYHATDTELHRAVALKFIREMHADHPGSRKRFLAEAEITARLDHPGVVPVYGLVADHRGRPCYAMRFVRGASFKDEIDTFHAAGGRPGMPVRRVAFRQLLQRFGAVCQAVGYAHSRGVIHRDLKPANVMVGSFGETLVVDWGLAKVVGRRHTSDPDPDEVTVEETLRPSGGDSDPSTETRMGTAVGTPGYMAPEQAAGRWDVVGPEADVYALGATLYSILTGKPPVSGKDQYEILQNVQRGDFPRPRQVNPAVPKPLEAVCLRAMAVKPEDRYPSAQALAADVEHWLADEPVSAHRDRLPARLARFARRNPAAVTGAGAVLATGLAAFAVGFVLMTAERDAKETARRGEQEQRELAQDRLTQVEQAKRDADDQRDVAVAVTEFLRRDLLGQADVADQRAGQRDPNVTVRELLDRSAAAVGTAFRDRPLVEAGVRLTIGNTYQALGQYDQALPHLERSLALRVQHHGPAHVETLAAKNNLAILHLNRADYAKSEPLFDEAVAGFTAALGADHPDTVSGKSSLAVLYISRGEYPRAEALLTEVVAAETKARGADHPDTLVSKNSLAILYSDQGKPEKAEPLRLEVLAGRAAKLGPDHPQTLTAKNNLALHYQDRGKYAAAEPLLREVLAARVTQLGADHPDTLTSKNNLAILCHTNGQDAEAEKLFQEALAGRTARLGPDHPRTLTSMSNLAGLYTDQEKFDAAEALLRDAVRLAAAKLGPDHPDTLVYKNNLALRYKNRGKYDLAEPLYKEVLAARLAKLGPDHPNTLTSKGNLALLYDARGHADRAVPVLLEVLAARERTQGPDHPDTLYVRAMLAAIHFWAGRYEQAEPLFRAALDGARRTLPAGHPEVQKYAGVLTVCYEKMGRPADAESFFRDRVAAARQKPGPDSLAYAGALVALGSNLIDQGRFADAEPVVREALTVRAAKDPTGWGTANTRSLLGRVLLGLKRYADAEPLLTAGYDGLKAKAGAIPGVVRRQRLDEALTGLIDLAAARGDSAAAAKWAAERAGLPREMAPPPRPAGG